MSFQVASGGSRVSDINMGGAVRRVVDVDDFFGLVDAGEDDDDDSLVVVLVEEGWTIT